MFVDEIEVTVEGGRGGDGKISFFPGRGGPDGGNGGDGGNVYAAASAQIVNLNNYTRQKVITGQAGGAGGSFRRYGATGEDLILKMPIGTTITDLETGGSHELEREGERVLLSRGGLGGRGNEAFKSPTHQTSRKRELGKDGESRRFKLVVKLIADIGFIGLPNAGKSSLLNELTAADVKTADYPFTTLEPNLGVMGKYVLADVPGLIEGASKGKGLGVKFLKHVEKIAILVHCISSESQDVEGDYRTVMEELEAYNPLLLQKNTIILLTKVDMATPKEIKEKTKLLKKLNPTVLPVSILDPKSLDELRKLLAT